MAKIGFSDVRRALTWGMSKDKDGNAIQFVTLVDSGDARHRVADPGAEVSHKKGQEKATRQRDVVHQAAWTWGRKPELVPKLSAASQ